MPGREYSEITLRYGVTLARTLRLVHVRGKVQRKNLSVVLLDSDGATEVARWNLVNAWATEWHGSLLDAHSQEVAIESLTLVCESIDRG